MYSKFLANFNVYSASWQHAAYVAGVNKTVKHEWMTCEHNEIICRSVGP